MKNKQKGSTTVIVLVFTVIVLLVIGGYVYIHFQSAQPIQDNPSNQVSDNNQTQPVQVNIPVQTSTTQPQSVTTTTVANTAASVPTQTSSQNNGSINLSDSDIASITAAVGLFKQAFMNNDEQGVLKYSSLVSQNIKISQLNTSFKSIGIKSISTCDSSCRPWYYTNNNEVSVVLTTINTSGVSGNMRWGFVKENGVWKFDLGLTLKLAHSI
jgi:hypothetical protein